MSSTNDPLPRADFYSAEGWAPEDSVGALMKAVMASITLQVDRRLVEHDLTHAQWVPLFKLAHGECQTVAELARTLQSDPGAMTRALDRLEAKGLVGRTRCPTDRRQVHCRITPAGLKLLDVLEAPVRDAGNATMRPIGAAGQKQLVKLLDRLRAALETGEHLR